jgi:glycosyltransferase involved in cell wall biosynthesis
MKKINVTIGIPCFQAEANIKTLLSSLIKQNENYCKVVKIIVYCDGCTDATSKNDLRGVLMSWLKEINRTYLFY